MRAVLSSVCGCLIFLILAWLPETVSAVGPEDPASWSLAADWGGHLRVIGSAAFYEEDTAQKALDRDLYLDGQAELRLNNELSMGDNWALTTHYELVALGGDGRENSSILATGNHLPAVLLPNSGVSDEGRFFDLTGVIAENERQLAYHRLDRLYLSFTPEWGGLRIGRQALTWGAGRIFNPMDLFNPFAPTTVQRDYKVGEDMAYLQLPVGPVDGDLLYVPRRDPQTDDLDEGQASYAAKLLWPAFGLEAEVMGARHYGDGVLGLGGSGYLGGALWRINTTYTHVTPGSGKDDFVQAVVNLDYAWMWGGRNVYGLLEFYYNQLGRTGAYHQALSDEVLLDRLSRGELFTLGRYYVAGQLQVELHPLLQFDAMGIVNLADPSGLLQPQLLWDLASDCQLIVGGQWNWGGDNSEFGGFNVSTAEGTARLAPADQIYMWLSFYY